MLVDSHCHLDFPDFSEERAAVVARARAAGVGRMVTISTRVRRFPQVLAIAEEFDDVFCSVGTHPHNAAEEPDVTADELAQLSAHPKVVAIGEAGLDYHYDKSPRDAQMQGFRTHIAAARQTGLPLVIHARNADADIAATLEDEMGKGAFPFILHCFSSGRELARIGRRSSAAMSPSQASSPSRIPRNCARSRRRCRRIGCWSRRMRPISRRFRCVESETSRPMSRIRQRFSPKRSAQVPRKYRK